MIRSRRVSLCASLAIVLMALTFGATDARAADDLLTTVLKTFSPDIADRISGSGMQCRSIAGEGGALHRLHFLSLNVHFGDRLSLRGGIGGASYTVASMLDPRTEGEALLGSVSLGLWKGAVFALDLNVTSVGARYESQFLTDTTAMVVFRVQPR